MKFADTSMPNLTVIDEPKESPDKLFADSSVNAPGLYVLKENEGVAYYTNGEPVLRSDALKLVAAGVVLLKGTEYCMLVSYNKSTGNFTFGSASENVTVGTTPEN